MQNWLSLLTWNLWGCFYVCFKTYLTCSSHRLPDVPWRLEPEENVFGGELTPKWKSFSEPSPQLWHFLPSAWQPLLQRAACWWLDLLICLARLTMLPIVFAVAYKKLPRGFSQRKHRNRNEGRKKQETKMAWGVAWICKIECKFHVFFQKTW